MSNSCISENIDTVVLEVLEDVITAVVSESSDHPIQTTVQLVLHDIVAMEFGCGDDEILDISTDNINKKRMVEIVDRLVDAMVYLVSETVSSTPLVQPGDESGDGGVVQCVEEEEEEEDIMNGGRNIEVVVDDPIPTEGEARIMSEALDCELDPVVNPATHAVTSRGRIRRFAAAAWRGVKRAGRVVFCCGCY